MKRPWMAGFCFGFAAAGFLGLAGCSKGGRSEVVVYAAQDQVYAEPIFQQFTKQTGIAVRPVYDNEAVKTVGMANRLLAEKDHPQCDVFWGNEELRARQLAARGVFRETNGLVTFGCRTRRLVVNTNKLSPADAPRSLLELTNAQWRGKIALAYPLFGTTATHFQALRQHWGEERWLAWCRALQANHPFLVDGNSAVVQTVARSDAVLGMTDSDDIAADRADGQPVAAVPLSSETLAIPNAVCVVRGAPHPREAEELFRYLQRPEVLEQLVKAGALEGAKPSAEGGLRVDWDKLLKDLDAATEQTRGIFLR
jgi:iron(III) transport system substrate-binding protein